jgi:hypothetical protein
MNGEVVEALRRAKLTNVLVEPIDEVEFYEI